MEISIIDDCWCLLTDNDGHWGKKNQNKTKTPPNQQKTNQKKRLQLNCRIPKDGLDGLN